MNGQRGEAIAKYRQVIALNPGDADPHNDLAVVLNEEGKLDEAIREFRQAIKLNPRLVAPHLGLSDVLHTAKVRATRRSRS
jgi:Flp pilus assembly protein TadD